MDRRGGFLAGGGRKSIHREACRSFVKRLADRAGRGVGRAKAAWSVGECDHREFLSRSAQPDHDSARASDVQELAPCFGLGT